MGWNRTVCLFIVCLLGWRGSRFVGAVPPGPLTGDQQKLRDAGLRIDDAALLDFFRRQTLTADARAKLATLVQRLGDKSFKVRDRASVELPALGMIAAPFLRQAAASADLEVACRAQACLRQIEEKDLRVGVPAAAARLVAARKPEGATDVLLAFVPSAENDSVADEVRAALVAVAVRDDKPEPALLAALDDPVPARRAVAVEALSQAGLARKLPQVRKLLHDQDLEVRQRTGVALALAGDKEAIPVLIDLLAVLPPAHARQVEALLLRLAGDKAPSAALGQDDNSRSKCRAAWAAWWHERNGKVDLGQLDGIKPLLGFTLLVMLDIGRVVEVDADNKPRFQIDGLLFPLDAQMLPEDRVLVAEHNGNRVTERKRTGEIVWEKGVQMPLVAQRLDNGNTFIATVSQFLEVEPSGKVVMTRGLPSGESIMKAQMLANGDIACVTSPPSPRFVRIDAAGKEIQNFPVSVHTSGGRIDVLANGHVLVPEMKNNRVAEYDTNGKVVWQVPFNQPIAAVRLANGDTLVTSLNQPRAVELDRTGNDVWEYKTDTRVTRAFRR
jgi:HEAT repeats/PQQ-like domain